jgi:hypothetical protein
LFFYHFSKIIDSTRLTSTPPRLPWAISKIHLKEISTKEPGNPANKNHAYRTLACSLHLEKPLVKPQENDRLAFMVRVLPASTSM